MSIKFNSFQKFLHFTLKTHFKIISYSTNCSRTRANSIGARRKRICRSLFYVSTIFLSFSTTSNCNWKCAFFKHLLKVFSKKYYLCNRLRILGHKNLIRFLLKYWIIFLNHEKILTLWEKKIPFDSHSSLEKMNKYWNLFFFTWIKLLSLCVTSSIFGCGLARIILKESVFDSFSFWLEHNLF